MSKGAWIILGVAGIVAVGVYYARKYAMQQADGVRTWLQAGGTAAPAGGSSPSAQPVPAQVVAQNPTTGQPSLLDQVDWYKGMVKAGVNSFVARDAADQTYAGFLAAGFTDAEAKARTWAFYPAWDGKEGRIA